MPALTGQSNNMTLKKVQQNAALWLHVFELEAPSVVRLGFQLDFIYCSTSTPFHCAFLKKYCAFTGHKRPTAATLDSDKSDPVAYSSSQSEDARVKTYFFSAFLQISVYSSTFSVVFLFLLPINIFFFVWWTCLISSKITLPMEQMESFTEQRD